MKVFGVSAVEVGVAMVRMVIGVGMGWLRIWEVAYTVNIFCCYILFDIYFLSLYISPVIHCLTQTPYSNSLIMHVHLLTSETHLLYKFVVFYFVLLFCREPQISRKYYYTGVRSVYSLPLNEKKKPFVFERRKKIC